MISVQSISKVLKNAIEKGIQTPLKPFASIILYCGITQRHGLSTISTVSKIAERLGQAGLPTGNFSDGTPNHMMQYTNIVVDEIYRELRNNACIQIVLPPGSITVQAGQYPGTNTNFVQGNACIM